MIKIPGLSSSQYAGRAIVMYGRSLMALEIAYSLGERGIEVIGCDDVDFTVLSFSRFVKKHSRTRRMTRIRKNLS